MDKRLIIIRGIPGAGKSTLARTIANQNSEFGDNMGEEVPICEADQFFTEHGRYHYIPHLVPTAHAWCQKKCRTAMRAQRPLVIVSNTGASAEKLKVYLDLAVEFGYQVQQIVCFANFGSIHNVPEESMKKHREQLRQGLLHELKEGKLL